MINFGIIYINIRKIKQTNKKKKQERISQVKALGVLTVISKMCIAAFAAFFPRKDTYPNISYLVLGAQCPNFSNSV